MLGQARAGDHPPLVLRFSSSTEQVLSSRGARGASLHTVFLSWNSGIMSERSRLEEGGTYLLLYPAELPHLDDERGSSALVLNGSDESPSLVHAEGLRPAPIAPTLNTDVQQLERKTIVIVPKVPTKIPSWNEKPSCWKTFVFGIFRICFLSNLHYSSTSSLSNQAKNSKYAT